MSVFYGDHPWGLLGEAVSFKDYVLDIPGGVVLRHEPIRGTASLVYIPMVSAIPSENGRVRLISTMAGQMEAILGATKRTMEGG